jgi:hypothetical protein
MVGISPEKLFGSLTDAELLKIFSDPHHLGKNGQEGFTKAITPKILELYDSSSNH